MTPVARTLQRLREQGFKAEKVEQFFGGKRHDLFGLFDVVYLNGRIVGVQVTDMAHRAAHQKLTAEQAETLSKWVGCGGTYELWAWRKLKVKRGGKATQWDVEIGGFTR